MKIDCRPYKQTLDNVAHQFLKDDIGLAGAMVAATTHVPAIVVCAYMLKFVFPGNVKLLDTYNGLVKFYRYTEVIDFE